MALAVDVVNAAIGTDADAHDAWSAGVDACKFAAVKTVGDDVAGRVVGHEDAAAIERKTARLDEARAHHRLNRATHHHALVGAVEVGVDGRAELSNRRVEHGDAAVAGVSDVHEVAREVHLEVRGNAGHVTDLPLNVTPNDAVAVVGAAGSVVELEVVERDRLVLAIKNEIRVGARPCDARAVGRIVQHVVVAGVTALELRDVARPKRRPHEVPGRARLRDLVFLVRGRKALVRAKGKRRRLGQEVGAARTGVLADRRLLRAPTLNHRHRVIGLVDHPNLGRHVGVECDVAWLRESVVDVGDHRKLPRRIVTKLGDRRHHRRVVHAAVVVVGRRCAVATTHRAVVFAAVAVLGTARVAVTRARALASTCTDVAAHAEHMAVCLAAKLVDMVFDLGAPRRLAATGRREHQSADTQNSENNAVHTRGLAELFSL